MMLKSSCGDPQVTWDLGPGSMGLEGPGTGKASWWRVVGRAREMEGQGATGVERWVGRQKLVGRKGPR